MCYENDLDTYHREKELKSHSIKKPELDSYYNNLNSESEVSKMLQIGGDNVMKKSVFDLTYKEGKEVDRAMRKTSYYKQYLTQYALIVVVYAFVMGLMIGIASSITSFDPHIADLIEISGIIITVGFLAVICLLFAFKRFDLVKKYYEEKVKKD